MLWKGKVRMSLAAGETGHRHAERDLPLSPPAPRCFAAAKVHHLRAFPSQDLAPHATHHTDGIFFNNSRCKGLTSTSTHLPHREPIEDPHLDGSSTCCRRWSRRSSFLRTLQALRSGLNVLLTCPKGRAGLVAFRRYRGGTNAMGKAFYKGGFERQMNRREAALILETP